jgi:hypothetical protein
MEQSRNWDYVASIKTPAAYVVAPCSLVKFHRRFGGDCYLRQTQETTIHILTAE